MGEGSGHLDDMLSILERFLGDHVGRIIPAGKGPQASWRCPFHKSGHERRPSFYINLATGDAFCHTCDEGWSLQGILARVGAPRAMRDLAQSYITSERPDPFKRRPTTQFLPEALLGVYEYCPKPLLEAGFEMDLLRAYDVGYDLRLDRITYPIRDQDGNLVGISGGSPFGDLPKYKVYSREDLQPAMPELYVPKEAPEKSFYLWNLDRVWASAFRGPYEGPIVVCEGFKAALWVIQSGFPMTVAAMGTYLSHFQTMLLLHMSNTIVLFFDQDNAGRKATEKAMKWIRHAGGRVQAASYPRKDAKQPDNLHPREVREAIEHRRL